MMKLAMNILNSEDSHECIHHLRISVVITTVVTSLWNGGELQNLDFFPGSTLSFQRLIYLSFRLFSQNSS